MCLEAYISNDDVIEKLSQYGEILGQVIWLKYKHDHDLGGLENGNRLVGMVLPSPSMPYSLNSGSERCRVIHNNQILLCSHCNGIGHSGKNCRRSNVGIANKWATYLFIVPRKLQDIQKRTLMKSNLTPKTSKQKLPKNEQLHRRWNKILSLNVYKKWNKKLHLLTTMNIMIWTLV